MVLQAPEYHFPGAHAQDYYPTNGYGHREDHSENGNCQNGSSIQMLTPYISSTPESTEHHAVVKENYGYEDQNDGYSDGTHHYGNTHEGFYGNEHSEPSCRAEKHYIGLRRNRYKFIPNKRYVVAIKQPDITVANEPAGPTRFTDGLPKFFGSSRGSKN